MKLEDIKNSVVHQCEVNLKRSLYDLCVFRNREYIDGLVMATLDDVFDYYRPTDEVSEEDLSSEVL